MNGNIKRWSQLSLYALILGCTSSQQSETQPVKGTDGTGNQSNVMNKSTPQTVPDDISVDQQIKDAVTDLATRINVSENTITIREARSVQWRSGAQGCPKPGMNYTQALVPGLRLLLEVNGTVYYYHGSTGRRLFFCPAERVEAPAYGQGLEVM